MKKFLTDIGAMRVLLLILLAICLPMALFSDADPVGLGLLSAYIAPTIVVLLFCVLLLDALMSRVFSIEQTEEVKRLHRVRIRTDLLAVVAIMLSWGPFFYQLLVI